MATKQGWHKKLLRYDQVFEIERSIDMACQTVPMRLLAGTVVSQKRVEELK